MISFRPVALPEDESLLLRIYRSTREPELNQTPWTEAEKHSFICMQFSAQHTHYHAHYPDCEYLIILKDGIPIGRLYIDTRPETIHIIDIALLAPHRKQGIGSRIMSEILADAQRLGRDVGIYVEAHNPAMHLYVRLGFTKTDHQGIYFLMHWTSGEAKSNSVPRIWAESEITT